MEQENLVQLDSLTFGMNQITKRMNQIIELQQ